MENGEKKTVSRKVIDREVIMRKYHVHIKNFRNLKDVKVTLSPLTILTGENGSGKSTLFKALLFLKHNHDHEAAKKLKYVIDDDINLGGWEHIANDPKKPISIKITEETWGYDHEVEEIYDIDNCPFELNPTEEYAERMWRDSISRIPGIPKEKKRFSFQRNFLECKKLTARKTSTEYTYDEYRLRWINIGLGYEQVTFKLGYALTENPNMSDLVVPDNDINRDAYFLGIADVKTEYDDRININKDLWLLSQLVNKSEDIRFNPLSTEIKEKSDYQIGLFSASVLSQNHVLFNEQGLLAWRLAAGDLLKFRKLNEIYLIIFQHGLIFSKPLYSSTMIKTVREIPKRVYLKEQISVDTYYGILKMSLTSEKDLDEDDRSCFRFSLRRINYWLRKFNIGNNLSSSETEDIVKFYVKLEKNKSIAISEASSGALQLLPIIYHLCSYEKSKKTYFIQQPELHLHPRLQSEVIDFFLDTLNPSIRQTEFVVTYDRRQNVYGTSHNLGGNSGANYDLDPRINEKGSFLPHYIPANSLIIETHSEHLLKKLQVLVSQGKTLQLWPEGHCSGEDVKLKDALSIYYFAKDKNGNTKAIEMELDDNGFFKTETPKGFFDESLELNRQLLLGRN